MKALELDQAFREILAMIGRLGAALVEEGSTVENKTIADVSSASAILEDARKREMAANVKRQSGTFPGRPRRTGYATTSQGEKLLGFSLTGRG